ncbi:cytosolic phospholipase A2 gamma-like [Engraulis encrasicolus]|uniref:cytosolic phospholipase A2 gamma-like n=1 Tax=Engraulis encrasicolus TaxID=184585 RepID=UPI002FD0A87A
MDVVVSHDLCNEEKSFVQERLKVIDSCLRSHDIHCKSSAPPRVALLGSGGGQRADVALLGTLRQLAEENILDAFLYLAGVSGSTWAMASLYGDPQWSRNAGAAVERALQAMSEGQSSTFSECVQWLRQRDEQGHLSLSDFWGVVVCFSKGAMLEPRTLSEESGEDIDATNPYQIYSAIERRRFEQKEKDLWFELSPDQAGFTCPGAFIKTSLLKQHFDAGHVTLQPERKPMDMVELQGICGSVLASMQGDWKMFLGIIKNWVHQFFPGSSISLSVAKRGMQQALMFLMELVDDFDDMEASHGVLEKLKSQLKDDFGLISKTLIEMETTAWTVMSTEEKRECLKLILDELAESLKLQMVDSRARSGNPNLDGLWVITKILQLAYSWQFGNTDNFLYNLRDSRVPKDMCERDMMHLIDAGLYLNSAYPPVLREGRAVDIIVSFDFSEDQPFQTLKGAMEYAAMNKRPFPTINLSGLNEACPKPWYVFEEKGKPTVIHIPLFNRGNCKDTATIEEKRKEYRTFQMPYREPRKVQHLADLAAENVRRSSHVILDQIQKAAERNKQQPCIIL